MEKVIVAEYLSDGGPTGYQNVRKKNLMRIDGQRNLFDKDPSFLFHDAPDKGDKTRRDC